jgi:Protein of unknown function (DUF3499)
MNSGPKWSLRHGSQYQRLCARPGCGAPATATLRFQSTQRQAWLVELDENAARTQGDLCPRHAAALVLPRGWVLHDERAPVGWSPVANGTTAENVETREGTEPIAEPVSDPAPVPEPEPEPAASAEPAPRGVPAQFGPNDDDDSDVEEALGEILDARTPLLQRAFRNAKPKDS